MSTTYDMVFKGIHTWTQATPESNALIFDRIPADRPLLTVALSEKWYGLYIVYPSGAVSHIAFPDEDNYEVLGSPYVDHAPNPRHITRFAEKNGYDIHPVALDLITGRFVLEGENYKVYPDE